MAIAPPLTYLSVPPMPLSWVHLVPTLHKHALALLLLASLVFVAACSSDSVTAPQTKPRLEFQLIDAGGSNTCGLTAAGEAWCWGNNDGGKLGVAASTGEYAWAPTKVVGSISFSNLANGDAHTCAVATTGVGYCWGKNYVASLGSGAPPNTTLATPTPVSGGFTWRQISASMLHSCGVTTANIAYCWGFGSAGQLGNGSYDAALAPTLVSGGLSFTSVTSRGGGAELTQMTCGLDLGGAAWCWGGNQNGQLGTGSMGGGETDSVPVPVSGGLTFTRLSAEGGYACGISMGALYCWGRNTPVPTLVPGGLVWGSISVSPTHQCGLTTTGAAYCWGENDFGQLGVGSIPGPWPAPLPVSGGLTFIAISAGNYHTCGLTTSGEAYCWGFAEEGLLGIGALPAHTPPLTYNVPTAVAPPD